MSWEPPPFQEASRCDVCKCSFNTFRRRHHCRCCGRTLCAEHSSDQKALPQFRIYTCVRVCSDCYNRASWDADSQNGWDGVNHITDAVSRLETSAIGDLETRSTASQSPSAGFSDCKCGMPLCICKPLAPSAVTLQKNTTSSFAGQTNLKPRKAHTTSKSIGSSSNSNNCPSLLTSNMLEKPQTDYEVNGEGLREAIKNGDNIAVKKLLSEGVDANYCDKQGSSLLHLAAVFNQTEIAFALMERGARIDCKNSQGETPLDCAPAMLQYKMQKKMEGGEQLG